MACKGPRKNSFLISSSVGTVCIYYESIMTQVTDFCLLRAEVILFVSQVPLNMMFGYSTSLRSMTQVSILFPVPERLFYQIKERKLGGDFEIFSFWIYGRSGGRHKERKMMDNVIIYVKLFSRMWVET